jgi:hypothetical protein
MSVVSNNILAGASGQGGAGYEIERSLRFNSGDSAYLNRTPSAAGNRKTFTWSGWVKRSNITESAEKLIFGAGTSSGSNVDSLSITAADQIRVFSYGGSYVWQKITTAVFRDPSAWYHIVYSVDTTNATAEDRVKIYVNGVRLTTFGTNTNPTQNADAAHTNTTNAHYICKYLDAAIYANSYLADVHFIDGQALAPTDFGETDDNGVWQPKEFAGTYNAPASFPSYPHVTINPTALGSGSDISHINGGGTYFYSNAQSGAGSVKVEFENPITGVTNIKYNGGAYSVNAIYNIKINGTDVFTNLSTASNWAQVSHTISSTDISSFEIYTANDGWSLYNLLFNDTSPSGTASLESTAGVNGFHLDFADNSSNAALGTDTSGNSNTWTVNNLSVAAGANNDSLVDTPTNGDPANDTGAGGEITGNYATLNPLYTRSSATFSDGNLKLASSTYYSSGVPTISLDNGKWYFEGQIITDGANGYSMIGVTTAPENETYSGGGGGNEEGFGWYSATGGLYPITGSYSSWAVGDVVSVAYDSVTRKTWLAKNGTWQNSGDPAAGTGSVATIPGTKTAYFSIATGTNGVVIANFGQRAFAYAAPSGYKCLCTTNLPEPTIADGSKYFDVALDTGANILSTATAKTDNAGFVWIKDRDNASTNHILFNKVNDPGMDGTPHLRSNEPDTEATCGTYSAPSGNSVGWAWDAGSSNTTIAAGGLNSSLYNQSQTWSTYGTFTGDISGDYDWEGVFSASMQYDDVGSMYLASGTGKWTLTSSIACNSGVKFYVNGSTSITINEGLSDEITQSSTGSGFHYFTIPFSGNISSIKVNTAAIYLIRIYVDGAALIDAGITLGGTDVPNVPSIASTVRANPSAGFSIVSYSGVDTPSTNTVAHGLNVAPSVYIIKNRTSQSYLGWIFNTTVIDGSVDYLVLNSTNAKTDQGSPWSTLPTSSVFTLGANDGNTCDAGDDFIAYCFAPVEGYSAMGSYVGNGSADGPFVYTGFRPAMVLRKSSSSNISDWTIMDQERDPINQTSNILRPNLSNAEVADQYSYMDILSNGFKARSSGSYGNNVSGTTYIYLAFAENPFKTARAR